MYPERIGGTYSYIYELYRRLAARGHKVDVIASTRSGAGSTDDLDGIRVHRYAFRRVNPILSTLQHLHKTYRLYESVAAEEPVDVLSIHEPQLAYRLARSPLGRSVCQLPTFHAPEFLEFRFDTAWRIRNSKSPLKRLALRVSEPPLEYWQRRFQAGVLEAADGILVLSEYSRKHIEREFPTVDLDCVTIIPSGVDTDRFRPAQDRRAVRRILDLSDDVVQLLTVRKLTPRMGLENLLAAMPTVVDAASSRGLRVQLSICGSGPLLPTLKALALDLGIAEHVRFAGRVADEDLVRYYQAADLFVLPTTTMEGFGISTVEALSTNTPVVGTPAGATPEILASIDPRLLTSDTTPGGIAAGIVAWFDWRREDAGTTRYRDEVLAKYDWDRVAERVEEYYAEEAEAFRRGRGA